MTRFYIEGAEEFDRACRLLDKRDVPYDIDGGDQHGSQTSLADKSIAILKGELS